MGSRGNEFSADEQRTLMTLWTIARSPLIMGEGRYLAVFQRHRCRQGHRHPPAGTGDAHVREIRDLWTGKEVRTGHERISAVLPAQAALLVRLQG